jgi:guanylate kinase
MGEALGEMKRATEYDYIVVNDDIEVAVDNINAVIQGHRLRLQNQRHIINEVLEKC